ncbi:DUF1800 domain-containing protein [Inhella proteolytica]|uniref:DUF1800 domain-containing protein n=1 Tax=Inhella proteolytica TaxID=2795029 RepID=A0A931NCX8_9BURK|nr:DUF1800 family protein [Inhella proteolytica]MBH9576062.1 DUF1800 domain-containing protein [Inhella proteolytica]
MHPTLAPWSRWVLPLLVLLSACGGANGPNSPATPTEPPAPSNSQGQVAPPASAQKVSFYAASRFAEQASFGPTPALVAEIQAKGFERWMDEQLALPTSQIDLAEYRSAPRPIPRSYYDRLSREVTQLFVAAPDQLRLRATWTLSQILVISLRKIEPPGVANWFNLLQQHGLGRYGDLLNAVSRNPAMGYYLDNIENRPRSPQCPACAPNENYARELMQLFSIGVVKLHPDGTPVRDAKGRFVESYSQRDVEELARVLSGWSWKDPGPGASAWAFYLDPMVPSPFSRDRDAGAKRMLGREFPAGQSHEKDLRDAVDLLVNHPNTAPFVAQRFIQHFVKSQPSSAYVARVSAKFRDNGQGVVGDMKAVLKAVLLDAEARAGDNPSQFVAQDGKFREPLLFATALWRGMECRSIPVTHGGSAAIPRSQEPFNAESVFSFYAPTDRAAGSNLLAPEQRLFTQTELRDRLGWPSSAISYPPTGRQRYDNYEQAGCALDELAGQFTRSPAAFADWVSRRYFRGAIPPTLRNTVQQFVSDPQAPFQRDDYRNAALMTLGYTLSTPSYGVMR